MDGLGKRLTKRSGHFMKNRKGEIILGLVLVVVGCLLLWDAFDNRGKKMPWPGGGLAPW
jgi:putative Mn2+ efflux pump MntP